MFGAGSTPRVVLKPFERPMADAAKPSPPELKNLKPALPDVWDLAKLEASVNATSQRAVTQWLAYLSLWAYLFFTTLSITDRALILLTPVKLPLIGVELGLQAFFWSGPPLFLVFHLYLVRKITVLARDVGFYRAAIHRFVPSEEAREPLYRRLDAFFLTRLLGHAEQGNLLRLFDGMIALATVALMPLALMLAFQLRFLAFHDEYVTMWHRICLVADVGLLVLLARWLKAVLGGRLRLLPEARGLCLRGGMDMARDMVGPVMVAYVAFSLLVATFPGEIHDWVLSLPDQKPDFLWRALAPRDVDFVDDDKLDKVQWTIDLRGRDLRWANLEGADLRKARVVGANLQNANLSHSTLGESDFSESNISHADLSNSDISNANFKKIYAISSLFNNSSINGSDFSEGEYYFGVFSQASIVGVNMRESDFSGAGFIGSDLKGSSARYAKFNLSSFDGADAQGVDFAGADLSEAFFSGTKVWGVSFDNSTKAENINVYQDFNFNKIQILPEKTEELKDISKRAIDRRKNWLAQKFVEKFAIDDSGGNKEISETLKKRKELKKKIQNISSKINNIFCENTNVFLNHFINYQYLVQYKDMSDFSMSGLLEHLSLRGYLRDAEEMCPSVFNKDKYYVGLTSFPREEKKNCPSWLQGPKENRMIQRNACGRKIRKPKK
jgi:uncharacterized protein YjbI with pentapeptide repeats